MDQVCREVIREDSKPVVQEVICRFQLKNFEVISLEKLRPVISGHIKFQAKELYIVY